MTGFAGRPHPARVYDYPLGGKDNFAVDRAAAEQGLKVNPNAATAPRQNRAAMSAPGVVPIPRWRPDEDVPFTDAEVALYGGVARKP